MGSGPIAMASACISNGIHSARVMSLERRMTHESHHRRRVHPKLRLVSLEAADSSAVAVAGGRPRYAAKPPTMRMQQLWVFSENPRAAKSPAKR